MFEEKLKEALIGKKTVKLDDNFYAEKGIEERLKCPSCGSSNLIETHCLAWGAHPQYECCDCGKKTGFYEMMGKNMIRAVEE